MGSSLFPVSSKVANVVPPDWKQSLPLTDLIQELPVDIPGRGCLPTPGAAREAHPPSLQRESHLSHGCCWAAWRCGH